MKQPCDFINMTNCLSGSLAMQDFCLLWKCIVSFLFAVVLAIHSSVLYQKLCYLSH